MEGLQLFSPLPTPSHSPTLASQRPLLGPCTQTHYHATLLVHHTQPASSQTSLHNTRTPTSLSHANPGLPCTKIHQYCHRFHQHIQHADTPRPATASGLNPAHCQPATTPHKPQSTALLSARPDCHSSRLARPARSCKPQNPQPTARNTSPKPETANLLLPQDHWETQKTQKTQKTERL